MTDSFIRLLLLPFSIFSGHSHYSKAKKLESEGNFKDACYSYATAILNGGIINEKRVRQKIKNLWRQHGPFDYDQDFKDYIARCGDTPEHCAAAGHAAVMSIINEIV